MVTRKIVKIKNFTLRYRVQHRIGYYITINDNEHYSIYISLSELMKLFITEGLSMEDIIALWEKNRSITFKKATLYLNKDYINRELCICAGTDVTAVYLEKAQIPYLHEVDPETLIKIKGYLHKIFPEFTKELQADLDIKMKNTSKIFLSNNIKVIGIGEGGSNVVNHIFQQEVDGIDLVVCNSNLDFLKSSPIPNKILLSLNSHEDLNSIIELEDNIHKILDQNTKMVFIIAGLGGTTGTNVVSVISKLAKKKDILTIGIVTIPFEFEQIKRQEHASRGLEKLRNQVDSLLIFDNNKLKEVFGDLEITEGFHKVVEKITESLINIIKLCTDFSTFALNSVFNFNLIDLKAVLSNSGHLFTGFGIASGENRAKSAVLSALDAPLFYHNKITGAKNILLFIASGDMEINIDEIAEINGYIQAEAGYCANIIMRIGKDSNLGDTIIVNILATRFVIV